jgi:hypothetical protein
LPPAIKFPSWSVNREKYRRPADVLFPSWPDWGVAAFTVADVPAELRSEGGALFQFSVEHVPLEGNYAHSELRASKDGNPAKDVFLLGEEGLSPTIERPHSYHHPASTWPLTPQSALARGGQFQ